MAGCMPSKQADCAPATQWLNKCPKGLPKKWACLDPKIDFPTVDCIAADIVACGTLEKNPALFYSFGATTIEVRTEIRDKLSPKPVMFNDVLPQDWDDKITKEPRFGLLQGKIAEPGYMKRYDAYVNRFSAAMAKVAQGEVIIVTKTRISRNKGDGAYSLPDPQTPAENRWRLYEFPVAQRNPKVTSVVSYALEEKPLKKVVDFQPGVKGALLPMPSFPNPPKPASPRPASPQQPAPGSSKPKPASPKPAPAPKKPGPGKKSKRSSRVERREKMLTDARA
ncbi:hypothetical protein E8E12_001945 [Didymella heteroderae]|uniref:Uncharacterized protein n=1 Tax=Didymella heteroderae TaxID=1769908 RepID=A0A9P4WND9_9PLEO|nr:hypothetical protein E8E12_001945 [Didymella heteroderae]